VTSFATGGEPSPRLKTQFAYEPQTVRLRTESRAQKGPPIFLVSVVVCRGNYHIEVHEALPEVRGGDLVRFSGHVVFGARLR
jgi:hypothetical protein